VLKAVRLVLVTLAALLAIPAAAVHAAQRMPIGFFDDPSFRWSPARAQNLQLASSEGASVIHTTATWAALAPTRPADASNGDDPAYKLTDLDDLVFQAGLYNLRVMINITGTPKWANGGKAPNVMPKKLGDLTTFARMLATRYNGRTGHGSVSLWSVWNEPNLQLFLTPQFVGKKIVGPANYAKLFKAAYAGIKAGNPLAKVAIGETSARGRDKPLPGISATIAPATFAHLLSQVKGLKFDAWAHHPYPTSPNLPPMQKVRYPNVTLSTMSQFEKDLAKWFHRPVPIWVTEYGHETKPAEPHGVTLAQQAAYAKQALNFAKKDPNIQMFIWFTFGRKQAGVRQLRRGCAADRRLDEHGQGRCAGSRDHVRAVPGPLCGARRVDRDDLLRLQRPGQGDRGRSADGDARTRPVGHLHTHVRAGQGADVHRRRDAERGKRAPPVAHGVHHGFLSS
jgi:hypothetical protein